VLASWPEFVSSWTVDVGPKTQDSRPKTDGCHLLAGKQVDMESPTTALVARSRKAIGPDGRFVRSIPSSNLLK
jgi:hypothetical protein